MCVSEYVFIFAAQFKNMIKKIISTSAALFLYLLIGQNAQAQSLQIQINSQTKGVNLLSLQRMSFSEGNLIILGTTGINENYALSTIEKLYFASSTTSISSVKSSQAISVFPNPCTDILTIKGAENGEVVLTSIDGKVQFRETYQVGTSLDLSMLSSGFYLLSINGQILKLRKL